MKVSTPWIYSPRFDLAAIIGPSVFVTVAVWVWGRHWVNLGETPWWLWVLLVLGIDVAHVYSSLFRTYFDREELQRRRVLYVATPILCWLIGVGVYAILGAGAFWAVVTYAAIYHFVRQQYGFMMLYRRGEPTRDLGYRIDQLAIYLATVYPLVYWHTYARNFRWFDAFELYRLPSQVPEFICRFLYVAVIIAFLVKETYAVVSQNRFNIGKVLLLVATAAAWGTSIILFNGDFTFTLINIISHGIPYMALVWIYQFRRNQKQPENASRLLRFFQPKYIPMYILSLVGIAFLEEGIWDWTVWKSNPHIFGSSSLSMPPIVLVILIPLLTMPQLTHYVLDAFIWRVNKQGKETVRTALG
jgi:hypothetical protein